MFIYSTLSGTLKHDMTNKILLDIDGVMVTTPSWKKLTILEDGFAAFDPKCTSNLKRILKETSAEIVLTTSHKDSFSLDQWVAIFSLRGITPTKISIAKSHATRRQEIMDYFKYNNRANTVIIDDDKTLNDLPFDLKEIFVLTEPLIGINEEKANMAIEILNC